MDQKADNPVGRGRKVLLESTRRANRRARKSEYLEAGRAHNRAFDAWQAANRAAKARHPVED